MNLEELFIKEFRANLRYGADIRNIYSVPLPEDIKKWEVVKNKELGVLGIKDSYYSKLNKTVVGSIPRSANILKREIDLVTRNFKRDENGGIISSEVRVPEDCQAVVSKVNLDLPFNYKAEDSRLKYIDFISTAVKSFMYIIPKEVLYNLNTTALALSVKTMKGYQGKGYRTWKFGMLYLNIIPYNPNSKYIGTRILKTKVGLDYSEEIKSIVSYWISNNIIADPALCGCSDGKNLVLEDINIAYDSYCAREEFSLSDKEIYGGSDDSDLSNSDL